MFKLHLNKLLQWSINVNFYEFKSPIYALSLKKNLDLYLKTYYYCWVAYNQLFKSIIYA